MNYIDLVDMLQFEIKHMFLCNWSSAYVLCEEDPEIVNYLKFVNHHFLYVYSAFVFLEGMKNMLKMNANIPVSIVKNTKIA